LLNVLLLLMLCGHVSNDALHIVGARMPCASHIHSSQAQCEGDLWAFERIPRRIFQWSWVSCGLVSHEHMSKLTGMDEAFLMKEMESAPYDWKSIVELP
jgi:hypothetical protein